MARSASNRTPSPWLFASLLCGLTAGVLGAGAADSSQDGRRVVGLTNMGRDGTTLIRLWSDGTMEQSFVVGDVLYGMAAMEWQPVEVKPRPENLQEALRPRLAPAGSSSR